MENTRPDLSNGDLVVKNAPIESKQYTLTDSTAARGFIYWYTQTAENTFKHGQP